MAICLLMPRSPSLVCYGVPFCTSSKLSPWEGDHCHFSNFLAEMFINTNILVNVLLLLRFLHEPPPTYGIALFESSCNMSSSSDLHVDCCIKFELPSPAWVDGFLDISAA